MVDNEETRSQYGICEDVLLYVESGRLNNHFADELTARLSGEWKARLFISLTSEQFVRKTLVSQEKDTRLVRMIRNIKKSMGNLDNSQAWHKIFNERLNQKW